MGKDKDKKGKKYKKRKKGKKGRKDESLNRITPEAPPPAATNSKHAVQTALDEKQAVETSRRRSENYLAQAQQLSRTGSFGWTPATGEVHWSDETFRIYELDRTIKPTVELALQRTHPDDRALVRQAIDKTSRGEKEFDLTHRLQCDTLGRGAAQIQN